MGIIPNDYKEALGRLIVVASCTTDPAQALRLSRSIMSLTWAAIQKKRGKPPADFLTDWVDWKEAWDKVATSYANDSSLWAETLSKTSDIMDYFVSVCLKEDLISIASQDMYFSDMLLNKKPGSDAREE